jgi:glycosyltransferase involved in cell wall biosynthesis
MTGRHASSRRTDYRRVCGPLDAPVRPEVGGVVVIIPAFNEEASIGTVLGAIPAGLVSRVIVADNNSTDHTARNATRSGAEVVPAPVQGYGSACLAGINRLERLPEDERPGIVVFLDADFADDPSQLGTLIRPIVEGWADMVLGSRMILRQPAGALLPQAVFGNRLACALMGLFFGARYTDLGPFRAIRWVSLKKLAMRDPNYGWTVEMQIKAVRAGLRVVELPVSYRPRIGQSKISGTLGGSVKAGWKILLTIARYGMMELFRKPDRPGAGLRGKET